MQGYIPQVPGVSFYSLYSPDASLSDFSYGKKVASGIANFPALTTYNEPTLVRSEFMFYAWFAIDKMPFISNVLSVIDPYL